MDFGAGAPLMAAAASAPPPPPLYKIPGSVERRQAASPSSPSQPSLQPCAALVTHSLIPPPPPRPHPWVCLAPAHSLATSSQCSLLLASMVTSPVRGVRSIVLVAASIAAVAAAAIPAPAAAGSVFFRTPVGDIFASLDRVLRSSLVSVEAVPGTHRLLPTCYARQCCVTVCRQSAGIVRIMSWGAAADGSSNSNRPAFKAGCPLAFGTMSVGRGRVTIGDRVRVGRGYLYTNLAEVAALKACNTPRLEWAVGATRGQLRWGRVAGTPPGKEGGGGEGGAVVDVPRPPSAAKAVAHSACVGRCKPGLSGAVPAAPWCVPGWMRRRLRYASCVIACGAVQRFEF